MTHPKLARPNRLVHAAALVIAVAALVAVRYGAARVSTPAPALLGGVPVSISIDEDQRVLEPGERITLTAEVDNTLGGASSIELQITTEFGSGTLVALAAGSSVVTLPVAADEHAFDLSVLDFAGEMGVVRLKIVALNSAGDDVTQPGSTNALDLAVTPIRMNPVTTVKGSQVGDELEVTVRVESLVPVEATQEVQIAWTDGLSTGDLDLDARPSAIVVSGGAQQATIRIACTGSGSRLVKLTGYAGGASKSSGWVRLEVASSPPADTF